MPLALILLLRFSIALASVISTDRSASFASFYFTDYIILVIDMKTAQETAKNFISIHSIHVGNFNTIVLNFDKFLLKYFWKIYILAELLNRILSNSTLIISHFYFSW